MADETPEILSPVDTATLRKLRAQMVTGSDINDRLHAVVALVTQLVDAQMANPARVKRDKAAADKAKAEADKAEAERKAAEETAAKEQAAAAEASSAPKTAAGSRAAAR